MGKQKAKGTNAESHLVTYLRGHGFPATERRALSGGLDKGDINWLPWIATEVKNVRSPNYQAWLREAEVERINAHADTGIVIHKPHGVGLDNQGSWHVVMTLDSFLQLVEKVENAD